MCPRRVCTRIDNSKLVHAILIIAHKGPYVPGRYALSLCLPTPTNPSRQPTSLHSQFRREVWTACSLPRAHIQPSCWECGSEVCSDGQRDWGASSPRFVALRASSATSSSNANAPQHCPDDGEDVSGAERKRIAPFAYPGMWTEPNWGEP